MLNVYQFSAAKTKSTQKALQYLVYNEKKELKSFKEFYEDASQATDIVYDTWMRTEYDNASKCAVAGDEYQRYDSDKDLYPYWVFHTSAQHDKEDECDDLDGMVFRIGDDEGDRAFPPNHWNCFPANTAISTEHGWLNIDKIKIGDLIIGGSGNKQRVNFVHINQINNEIIGIINKRSEVFSTKNHRMLTIKGWVEAQNINIGDILINTKKVGSFNNIITYINNCYIFGCNKFMSFIIKRESTMVKTFNSQTQSRNENINPITTNIIIKNTVKSQRFNMFNHFGFINSWLNFGIRMTKWIFRMIFNHSRFNFRFNIFIKTWIEKLHSFGTFFKPFTIFFSFSSIRMWSFSNILSKSLACLFFPLLIIYPLKYYIFGITANWYIKLSQKLRNDSIIICFPSFHNFLKRHFLFDIK